MDLNLKLHSLLILITVFCFAAQASADPYVCGDANGNLVAEVADAVYLVSYIFADGTEPVPMSAGDADGNGSVNIADAAYLVAYVLGGGPAPICPYGTVTDIDGNIYWTVRIGEQWWMMENLKVTHYRNGDPIPHVTEVELGQVLVVERTVNMITIRLMSRPTAGCTTGMRSMTAATSLRQVGMCPQMMS